ncbi:hypothetical protein J3R83DRAFT_5623 [Lanmaoa asiatica]|nr:hypothetical protein J3R83DRAFT_5623 [Lanmaoa asiatica]
MVNEDHTRKYQQRIHPPRSVSPSFVRSSGADIPAAPQGETSENGPYVPSSVPPFDTSSSPVSFSTPFSESHAFPSGFSLISSGDTQFSPPGFTDFSPLTTGMHVWASQPPPNCPSFSSTSRPRSQTDPSLSSSSALAAQSHPAIHGQESQMTPGNPDQPASLARRALPSTFPAHPLAAQFAPGPPRTHRNSFPGQYVMSSHPPPFQNQLSQPRVYYGYPLESSPYPPTRYFPLPGHQPLPYLQNVEGSSPSYQQAQRFPLPVPQSATSSPGPSHAGSFGIQHAPLYSSTSNFGLPQQYQPNMYQWDHGPGSAADTFNRGVPMHAQQHYSMNNPRPWNQRPRRDSKTFRAQSTGSQHLPSPTLGPSSKSIAVTTSRDTTPPAAADSPELIFVQGSQKIDTHELNNKSAAIGTSRSHDRPPVRRHYHPNPPPNRSAWVMWVGNVPSDATHDELWRFLNHSAPLFSGSENSGGVEDSGVMSIFLISRSSCAFVNYQSEEHLNHAIAKFSGRKLRSQDRRCPRLVCRERRKEDDLRAGVGAQRGMGVHTHYVKNTLQMGIESVIKKTASSKGRLIDPSTISAPTSVPSASRDDEPSKPDTVEGVNPKVPTRSPSSYASTSSSLLVRHFPKRFFILKSLTKYDLDLSVERGVWATQKHNEAILDQAFRTSKEVVLIFSVNKSGEFYGYARMASGILRSNYSVSWAPRAGSSTSTSSPSSSRVRTPEQCESPSRRSPQMCTSLSDLQSVEASPFPVLPSSDETEDSPSAASSPRAKSAQERRSAPPALNRDSEDPVSPDPPPVKTPKYGWQEAKGTGVDDSGNPALHLQPVAEEAHSGNGVEEDTQHGHPEIQQREPSWGETFKIEWLCTKRVPFHRTRHLRNPWNHGREIKVSRDGTEVEPAVGQQMVEQWLTLASGAADDDARCDAGLAGGRVAKSKSVAKPGTSGESKATKEEPL